MASWLIVVPVPEAEPGVAQWRDRFDPAARRGLGAHVTLLHFPMSPGDLARYEAPEQRLAGRIESTAANVAAFSYQLTRTARFPGTLYLAVEPAAPFARLREQLLGALADSAPGAQESRPFVPHVSVVRKSRGDDSAAEQALNGWLARHGPVHCRGSTLALFEDSTGLWRPVAQFALSGCRDSPSPAPS